MASNDGANQPSGGVDMADELADLIAGLTDRLLQLRDSL